MSFQRYLNEISSSIKAKKYIHSSYEEKNDVLQELIQVIKKGTEHQSRRALSYMKQIGDQKSKF